MLHCDNTYQLTQDLSPCKFFLFALMKVQTLYHQQGLKNFRFCIGDEICEEMAAFLILPEHTTGAEICKADTNQSSSRQIDISNVVSITIDDAPALLVRRQAL